jgi:hypothetical protein
LDTGVVTVNVCVQRLLQVPHEPTQSIGGGIRVLLGVTAITFAPNWLERMVFPITAKSEEVFTVKRFAIFVLYLISEL